MEKQRSVHDMDNHERSCLTVGLGCGMMGAAGKGDAADAVPGEPARLRAFMHHKKEGELESTH